MNNKYKLVLGTLFLGMLATVNTKAADIDTEVEVELDQMYVQPSNTRRSAPTQNAQPVYILNQPQAQQVQAQTVPVQKQPMTYIEASPLNKSRADQMRESRQQTEAETETRIVEKLEQSRIEDEKRRASVLFGESFNQLQSGSQQSPVVAPAPAQQAAPQPIPVQVVMPPQQPQEDTRDIVREELRAALAEEQSAPEKVTEQRYFTGIAGIGEYPDVRNVQGNYVLGAAYGTKFEDTYSVEGAFVYSNYTLEKLDGYMIYDPYYGYIPRLVDVNQYSLSLAIKYMFLPGMIKPVFGGIAQYSYRTFTWSNDSYSGYNNYNQNQSQDTTSHAVDLGLITGVDIELNSKFTLGVDFRYLFNLSNRVNTNGRSFFNGPQYGTPIEKLQYYNLSLVARVHF